MYIEKYIVARLIDNVTNISNFQPWRTEIKVTKRNAVVALVLTNKFFERS